MQRDAIATHTRPNGQIACRKQTSAVGSIALATMTDHILGRQ